MSQPPYHPPDRSWLKRIADALRGAAAGIRGQRSFVVHFLFAAAVLVCGGLFRVSRLEWGLLLLCIAVVLAAEMFNSALEGLGRVVDDRYNPELGRALDIGSGAVLVAALGAAAAGLLVFVPHLAALLGWW